MNLLDQIKQLPSLANATEADVVAQLRDLENKATKLEATEQALAQVQAELTELREKALEGIVNTAITDGRITEAQKPMYLNLLKTNREETEKLLNSLPKPQTPIRRATHFIREQGGASNAFSGKSWDDLDKAGLSPELCREVPSIAELLHRLHHSSRLTMEVWYPPQPHDIAEVEGVEVEEDEVNADDIEDYEEDEEATPHYRVHDKRCITLTRVK